ncbi:hypothetical protein [Sphingomonas xinjiangensis]|uniref:Transposase DDE domain-containing protein n=1 Tax=Sphingomonas xinjiangensis TaxID=643568 RepID=A0A840YI31_9SPHN|nr:hypothetical protein [Sphingomonas xinjiangensis]MBB5712065.1 hypothetical protein [Sphingomonas xinjiangensis]
MLPNDFPPWQAVYLWFRRVVRRLSFRTIHGVTLMLDREHDGREQSPTAAVVDIRSIKTPAAEKREFDAGKKVVRHKRQITVDTDGRLLMVNLTTAEISDIAGAQTIVAAVRRPSSYGWDSFGAEETQCCSCWTCGPTNLSSANGIHGDANV